MGQKITTGLPPTTYLFYDIETSGLNKCFDQVLQFAAIRTDEFFNEINRHEYRIKLNCDVIPSPHAVLTHHISPTDDQGTFELEAIVRIHQLLNHPGTISLGYNTLAFDDEFLRFSFYRNLLPPYTHQFSQHCRRMDIYPMLIFFRLFRPTILKHWPVLDGQISLKLEHLNAANSLASGPAHNAMVDVEATLQLARCLKKDPAMWTYLEGYFQKNLDKSRAVQLEKFQVSTDFVFPSGLLIFGKFGKKLSYQAPVLGLGTHAHYLNQSLWLRLDMPELRQCTVDQPDKNSWVVSKKWGEPGFLLPLDTKYSAGLSEDRQEEIKKNKDFLEKNPAILEALVRYHRHFKYPSYPEVDVDAALYEKSFLSPEQERTCRAFHQASPAEKPALIERFGVPYLRELAIRILGRLDRSLLPEKEAAIFSAHLTQVSSKNTADLPIDFKGAPRYGLAQFEEDLKNLKNKESLTALERQLLAQLEKHICDFYSPDSRFNYSAQ